MKSILNLGDEIRTLRSTWVAIAYGAVDLCVLCVRITDKIIRKLSSGASGNSSKLLIFPEQSVSQNVVLKSQPSDRCFLARNMLGLVKENFFHHQTYAKDSNVS